MASTSLSGIFTPNITPLDSQLRIDEDKLRGYIDWLIDKGVHGLYPNGSTGEFIRFTVEERRQIMKIVVDQTAGRIPILAGAAEANADETIDACNAYADLGVRAVAIVAPYYYRLSSDGVYEFFKKIGDAVRIDVTLYNIPLFASPIDVETVSRLALDCPRIVGIKDSSGDISHMSRMIASVRPQRSDFFFLTGWDAAIAPMLLVGCDGGTNASSGVVPEITKSIYEAARASDWTSAMAAQINLLSLFDAMVSTSEFPEGFRRGTKVRGWDLGPSRQPLSKRQVEAADKTEIEIRKIIEQLLRDLPPQE